MKRLVTTPLLSVLAVAAMAAAAAAGPQVPTTDARFAIHLSLPTSKTTTACSTWSPLDPAHPGGQISCSSFVTSGATGTEYYAYLVAAKVDTNGIAGVSWGIEYNGDSQAGVDVFAWTMCADGLEFRSTGPRGEWPASGGGNRITWVTCQSTAIGTDGVQTVAGVLDVYAYSADLLRLTPNRPLDSGPESRISNCAGAEAEVDSTLHLGGINFGGGTGCDPCVTDCIWTPVEPVTWGKIKTLYR